MEISSPKLYRIQSEPDHFYTGRLPNGTQAFLANDSDNLIAILFDAEGNVCDILKKDYSQELKMAREALAHESSREKRAPIIGAVFDGFLEGLADWVSELGLTKETIQVRKVHIPEVGFAIQDLPGIYLEFLENDEPWDDDDKEEIREAIKEWKETNYFVLVWGNEYDIDAEGAVVST